MAKRGESFRREAKLRIIEYLIGRDCASPSELAEALGVSRVTVSALLDDLVDAELLSRLGERAYSILTGAKALLLRMGAESAEIITLELCGGKAQRTHLRMLESMSYTDNAARLLSMSERYAAELSVEGYKLYCAVICYGELPDRSIPKSFTRLSGDELLAKGLAKESGALLYIDGASRSSYLLLEGRIVSSGRVSERVASEMRGALGIIKPQRVVLVGADEATRRTAEQAVRAVRAEFSYIEDSALRPDERAAALELMAKLI